METRVLALKNNHRTLRKGVEQTFAQALARDTIGRADNPRNQIGGPLSLSGIGFLASKS
jgi:hypothetical protein